VSGDVHTPTHAGPGPGQPGESYGTAAGPAGVDTTASGAGAADDKPELLVGAAFAGGLVAAMILKRLRRDD
jgi:hypothetical protein